MRLRTAVLALFVALVGAGLATRSLAQIERLDLREMLSRADGAVFGTIEARDVIRVDDPLDGPELYYTFLSVAGRSLVTGEPTRIEVAFPGGFVDEEHGVHNSEAPSADDVALGNRVVVFHQWTDNLGGGVAAHALYASHGGLFRTAKGRGGTIVLGRGDGYAIDRNRTLGTLEADVTRLLDELGKARGGERR